MRKVISFLIPLLLLSLIGIIIAALEAKRQPDWQPELETYLVNKSASAAVRLQIESSVKASLPWHLKQDFIKGSPFRPFPPAEVWCILLQQSPQIADNTPIVSPYTVVFAVRHDDVHFTYWKIYEGAVDPTSPTFQESLHFIGCDLKFQPLKISRREL
jgi:hypothetical protein